MNRQINFPPISLKSTNTRNRVFETLFVYGLALSFVAIMFTLMVQKHNAFNTRVHDFARFSQAIWNTLDGQILYTSLSERSILGDHFSPIMALYAPLLWVWPNERVLFLVQAIHVAITGIIVYQTARAKHPTLAPIIALLFFLNPAVHEITLFELRRIVFGLPWLALGFYGLVTKNRPVMLLGLLVALLAKENIAIFVTMIGLYLIIIEKDWKWGSSLTVFGLAWALIIGTWIIPLFNQGTDTYPQLYYFSHLGDSYSDLIRLALTNPLTILRQMFGAPQIGAIIKIFLPLAFLSLLDISLLLIAVPYIAILFLSNDVDMYQIDKWYPTTLIPILFAAVISGWHKIPEQFRNFAKIGMVSTTILAYFLYSLAPFGGKFEPTLYQPDERDQMRTLMIERIPEDLNIESHPIFVPHLTHINDVYHHGFANDNPIDLILLDQKVQFSPYNQPKMDELIENMVANTENIIVEQIEKIYLFSNNQSPLPAYEISDTINEEIKLDRFEIAVANDDGFFENQTISNPKVRPGDMIRISMYWEALSNNIEETTISIRLSANDGFLLAQRDQMPANNFRPTSWWETGMQTRDVYYLQVPEGTSTQIGSVDLAMYNSWTQESVEFDNGTNLLQLIPIEISQD